MQINSSPNSLNIITIEHNKIKQYNTQKAIIAVGATPKSITLPPEHQHKALSLEIALSVKALGQLLKKHRENNPQKEISIAVIGSSHSAALAIMNIFAIMHSENMAIKIQQYANKEYKFASDKQYENTGLKGRVAVFMRKLLEDDWKPIMSAIKNFSEYTHIVSAIGLTAADTLEINGVPSSIIQYNLDTTETATKGVFMIGAGHPRQVIEQPSGEKAGNIGITKFWPDFQHAATTVWTNPVDDTDKIKLSTIKTGIFHRTLNQELGQTPTMPIISKL